MKPSAHLKLQRVSEIELFASEPLIQDPVGMDVDELGPHLRGSGSRLPGKTWRERIRSPAGGYQLVMAFRIRSTIFADSLQAPRGVMRWKQGILVTDAPDIIYFEDTTGDGKADLKQVLMSGFARGNPQLGVNTSKIRPG
jgi:hypothetical protein